MTANEQPRDNPAGTDGFEFVEYAAPDPRLLGASSSRWASRPSRGTARRTCCSTARARINFIVNREPDSLAAAIRAACTALGLRHGLPRARTPRRPCTSARGPGRQGRRTARSGRWSSTSRRSRASAAACSISWTAIGRRASRSTTSISSPIGGRRQEPKGFGLHLRRPPDPQRYRGNMEKWADFYERLFNFREIRYFDIKGVKTGLISKAMTAPDGMVRIPLNESSDPKSQINEYLNEYKGEGIQHIALLHRRHLRHRGGHAPGRHAVPGHARRLLRDGGRARARTTARTCRAWQANKHPHRRQTGRPRRSCCCRSSPRT